MKLQTKSFQKFEEKYSRFSRSNLLLLKKKYGDVGGHLRHSVLARQECFARGNLTEENFPAKPNCSDDMELGLASTKIFCSTELFG